MFKFEELNVYQDGLEFSKNMYLLSKKWPREETYGLVDQLKRAAVSISLNIAEGSSRTKKDFEHFLSLARGSCYEYVAVLQTARKLGYISESEFPQAYEECEKIARKISALKLSLRWTINEVTK